jgi:sec-independent protein translocase protein TatA
MLGIGMQEILIILLVALIVIGPKRLPEVARTLGKGFAEFKKATDDFQESVRKDLEQDKHQEFVKKYPHLVPEEEEEGKKESSPSEVSQPSVKTDEIGDGEETENKNRDV